jgi:hypothetical protein
MRIKTLPALGGVALLAASGAAVAFGSGGSGSRLDDGKALLPQAKVSEQRAIVAAQTAASGDLNEIDLEHFAGRLVWNVDVGSHDVKVDARSGEVVGSAGEEPEAGKAGAAAAGGGFGPHVDNPWYPLKPGTVMRYEGSEDGVKDVDVIHVTRRTKLIAGVRCRVVRDRLFKHGEVREDTRDYFAQDANGTVWYFGEDTRELDGQGHTTTREGTWRAGVKGAHQGIFMPAHPRVGQSFQQEHFKGHAEDHFRIKSLHASVTVPYRSFSGNAMRTREWTPLEPGVVDFKWYARGIGDVKEKTHKGGSEVLRLVTIAHH